MRIARPHHRKLLAEISVTPLLDLVFILLFAFMVALPLVSRSDALMGAVPEAGTTTARPPAQVVTLRVLSSGGLALEDEVLSTGEVEQRLQAGLLPSQPDLGVRVEIAGDMPVSALTEVMVLLAGAGVRRTTVSTVGAP